MSPIQEWKIFKNIPPRNTIFFLCVGIILILIGVIFYHAFKFILGVWILAGVGNFVYSYISYKKNKTNKE